MFETRKNTFEVFSLRCLVVFELCGTLFAMCGNSIPRDANY